MATLGIIIGQANVFQSAVITGIQSVAAQHHYEVRLFAGQERDAVLNSPDLSGILTIANAAPDSLLRAIHQMGLPASLVAHQVVGLPIPVVMSNNAEGIAALVEHLVVRCQRRSLVFIRGLMEQNDAIERELAFRQELIRHNVQLPESRYLKGDFAESVAAESMRQFVALGEPFDAVIGSDYMTAIVAADVLRQSAIQIPQQVSVVGYGDADEAEAAGLTTVAANVVELGACAARQLISQIKGAHISGVTMLSVRLVIRSTSGCN